MEKIISFIMSIAIVSSSAIGFREKDISKLYEFIVDENYIIMEQGVKGQYVSEDSVENEIKKIKEVLKIKEQFKKRDNCFYFDYKDDATELNIFASGEDGSKNIEVIVKRAQGFKELEFLEKELKRINGNIKISSYLKGKVNNNYSVDYNQKVLESKFREMNISNLESLPIDLGITGIGKAKNNQQINYAVVSYENNETYIIVGTPVIFITY